MLFRLFTRAITIAWVFSDFKHFHVFSHLKDLGEVTMNWTRVLHDLESRIIGGTPTTLNQYPFNVQFYNLGGLCGGSILAKKVVLTAAHCFDYNTNLAEMSIVSNSRYLFDQTATFHEVWDYVLHEHYNDTIIFSNDIALILIHGTFKFTSQVQRAVIGNSDVWMKENETFVATGWGYTKVIIKGGNSVRRILEVPSINFSVQYLQYTCTVVRLFTCLAPYPKINRECFNINYYLIQYQGEVSKDGLMKTHLNYVVRDKCMAENRMVLSPDMFCLHGDGKRDTCQGDSGGGVLWNGLLVGIVSHGKGCAMTPGMYANVYYFKPWIDTTVKRLYWRFCNFHGSAVNKSDIE